MSRSEQHTGKAGEARALRVLHSRGVEMVEKIGTPVRIIASKGGWHRIVWGDKVSGDHRGILPGGRSVLAETKTILDRNLHYSDLRDHQPDRLTLHAELGGLSLLVWVHQTGIFVMQWPIDGFVKGTGITPEEAVYLDIDDLGKI